jgi:phytoene dehydrogenase-like protein
MEANKIMEKKVIVIGAGIAGLSAGIYARKCGFDVTILESHSIAGGNCTSWKRGGYLFENGMHWLVGSARSNPINKLWRRLAALNDSVLIHYYEPYIELGNEGETVRMYRDIDLTERHFLELSPADAKEIRRLCNWVRKLKKLNMPVNNIRGVNVTKKSKIPLSLLLSGISALRVMSKTSKITKEEFMKRITHIGIRDIIGAYLVGKTNIAPLVFNMGTLARGDGGFPEGGSLPFIKRMVEEFTKIGGEILYKHKAERIVMENGKATGVIVGEKTISADAVIVTSDTMEIEKFFDTPPKAKWLDTMKAKTKPTMVTFVCLGINADLRKYNKHYYFKTKLPLKLGDETYDYLRVYNYAADPVYSPSGKSSVTIQIPRDTYDFWKKAKEENRYVEEKKKIADAVIKAIEAQIPETRGNVEVIDVATPLTYERYCANWRGSWMTEIVPNMKMTRYPSVIKGFNGCYFAGQRMAPPGGLPIALTSARAAVQYLCRDTKTLFVCEEDERIENT